MTRDDILSQFDSLTVSEHETLLDIVDFMEGKFSEINDLLELKCITDLTKIEEAKDIASTLSRDLY